jgi:hypothetical protein
MPTDEGPRLRRSHYAILGVAGIVIATLFAFVASLAVRPASQVQPLPDMPGPIVGDSTTTADPPTTPVITTTPTAEPTTTAPKPPTTTTTTTKAAQKPPAAVFMFTCNGPVCSFDGGGSHDPDGTIIHWTWTFGDRTGADGQQLAKAAHTYRAPGRYLVTLTVLDNTGKTARAGATITVP